MIRGQFAVNNKNVIGFVPPDEWKGRIARAVLCMSSKYPQYSKLILDNVLDRCVALDWNMLYPASESDKEWNSLIKAIQGDTNIYV